jgi:HEAT repeat protein
MTTKNLKTIVVLLIILSFSFVSAQDNLSKMENLLEQIKSYEYGQSRENLTSLNDLLRVIGNSDEEQIKAEKLMIDFLESDATLPAKQFVCENLSIYGSEQSVSVLEEMLSDPKTASMALFALERIQSNEASEVLIDGLSDGSKTLKIGILSALGNREEIEAIEDVIPLMKDPDKDIAYAAISAVGSIGGDEATESLKNALSDQNQMLRSELVSSYLKCAVKYEQNNKKDKALAIYQSLNKTDYNDQIRYAALNGIINNSKQSATEVIVAFLENESSDAYHIAIPLVRSIPESEDVTPIVKKLSEMTPDNQVKLLSALAGRKDPVVTKAMEKSVKSSNEKVRSAALQGLALSGNADTAMLFAQIAASGKGKDKLVARTGLDKLNAPGVDDLIVTSIPQSNDEIKIELLRCTSTRNITSAVPLLVNELNNENRDVRVASIKALRDLASPGELEVLIDHHRKVTDDKEMKELETTIVAVCKRIPENQSQSAILLSNLNNLQNVQIKASYLEMMGKIGDPKSLPVLEEMLSSKDDQLKTSAIRGLSNWPDADPAPDLLSIAKSSDNQVHRTLALRGYVDLLKKDEQIDAKEKTEKYKEAMNLAENATEKRQILSALARNRTIESFNFVATYLDDPDVKNEAETAVMRLAWRLGDEHMDVTLPVIKKVKDQTTNEEMREQITEMLDEIENDK